MSVACSGPGLVTGQRTRKLQCPPHHRPAQPASELLKAYKSLPANVSFSFDVPGPPQQRPLAPTTFVLGGIRGSLPTVACTVPTASTISAASPSRLKGNKGF